ncbi:pyridoxal phosphatase [Paludibacterium yongneupense]|uniref:pyridoxal phosphatase n=1 Tax=Paludibacterium yongneupense TaxID=400061 RepID=UPI00041DFE6E|nr:pyridoxal phosphatase [Paludibacterium yongneupense]
MPHATQPLRYRLLALDLDGTLLSSDQSILPETRDALFEVRRRGIDVVLVTGRQHIMAHPYHVELELDAPVVCCNGTYLYDFKRGEVLASDPLGRDSALELVSHGRRNGVDMVLYIDHMMTCERFDKRMQSLKDWAATVPEALRPDLRLSAHGFEADIAAADQVWKMVVSHDDPARIAHFVEEISGVLPVSCEWSWQNRVDVTRVGNSKGKRLAELAQQRGIAASEVIAFGDHLNDLSMLTYAGMGVAMGNAEQEVRDRADHVTASNDENGIAKALQRLVLASH